jgi:hypothetical protein
MGKLLEMTRHPETSNVECKQGPIFKNRGVIYMTQNYARRCNADGSFDSICLHRFKTVAATPIDASLAENEVQHRCIAPDPNISGEQQTRS